MKINNSKPPEGAESRSIKKPAESPKVGPAAKSAGAAGPVRSDSIEISKQGKEAAHLIDAIGQLPEIRVDQVNSLKEAVSAGSYKVDASKVAEKIVSEIV